MGSDTGAPSDLFTEAYEAMRGQPVSVKVGHLRSCTDALTGAYNDVCTNLTRETAQNFVAHISRFVTALEQVRKTNIATLKP